MMISILPSLSILQSAGFKRDAEMSGSKSLGSILVHVPFLVYFT
jgi:hypothetical protein